MSTAVIVVGDLLAVALIGHVLWLSGTTLRLVGGIVAAASLGAVRLDLREAVHQHDLGNRGLVLLVTVVAAIHLAAAIAGRCLPAVRTAPRLRSSEHSRAHGVTTSRAVITCPLCATRAAEPMPGGRLPTRLPLRRLWWDAPAEGWRLLRGLLLKRLALEGGSCLSSAARSLNQNPGSNA